jgi:O-antigen ligase
MIATTSVTPPMIRADAVVESERQAVTYGLLAFLALHAVIGPPMFYIRQLAVLHLFIVSGIGFWLAISRNRPLEWVAYVGAYVTGAEVLWRMTRVAGTIVFYEYAKYLLAALFLIALVVRGQLSSKWQKLAVVYFALLLPSSLIPLTAHEFDVARGDLSFNLSGPLTLTISAIFFSQIDPAKLRKRPFLLALIAPVVTMAVITLFVMLVTTVEFVGGSNKSASGHFGPNQVSAMMGLAALGAVLLILEDRASKTFRVLMFLLMAFLLIQSAMTYSRGGLYAFSGAVIVAFFFYVARDSTKFWRLVAVGIVALLLADYVVMPKLDALTDGSLTKRFTDFGLTGRDTLAASELELFRENLVFGVGPGQLVYQRDVSLANVGAHTEFSRLVAEHGLFGLGSLILLIAIAARTARAGTSGGHKVLALAGVTWAFLFMSNAGMRIVAPAFLVGLAGITQGAYAVRRRVVARPSCFRHLPRAQRIAAGY